MRHLLPCPPCGRQGRPGEGFLAGSNTSRAAGERPPRARPQRRGSPGPIPNPAVKPAFAESTAAQGCGRAGRRARGGRFSFCARRTRRTRRRPAGDRPLAGLLAFGAHGDPRCVRLRPLAAPGRRRATARRRALAALPAAAPRGFLGPIGPVHRGWFDRDSCAGALQEPSEMRRFSCVSSLRLGVFSRRSYRLGDCRGILRVAAG